MHSFITIKGSIGGAGKDKFLYHHISAFEMMQLCVESAANTLKRKILHVCSLCQSFIFVYPAKKESNQFF